MKLDDIDPKDISKKHKLIVRPGTKKVIAFYFIQACKESGISNPVNPSNTDVAKALGVQKILAEQRATVTILDLIEDLCSKWSRLESVRKFAKPKPELGMLPLCYKELLQKREEGDSIPEVIFND